MSAYTQSENEANQDAIFLRKMMDLVMNEGLQAARSRENQVCEFHQPEKLQELMSGYLPIGKQPASQESLLDACKDFIQYSVKTTHPRFYNQLFGGLDINSLGGALLTEALNASLYTYEVAPVFTIMELEIYNKMLNFIGFDGGEAIFVPGGSMGNLYGMSVARYSKFPEVKTKGLFALSKPLCMFTSEKCHYSLEKAAFTLGLGSDNVISIKTDEAGKMLVDDLTKQIKKSIEQGFAPFMVNATAGTTVFGAFDPIDEIAEVCKKYDLWLHVDGAYGGSVLLSREHKNLVKGIEKADSMTWNPHKMMGASQQCSVFLTKHKGMIQACNSACAKYLFQQDKHYDTSYDVGDMSLQCGRRNDVLKLWMLWKGKGDLGMEKAIDHLFMLTRYLAEKVKSTNGYRLMLEPEGTNVCFYYIPPSLRGLEETDEWWNKIGKVPPVIKARMMESGSMMVGYNPEGKYVNFFRMVLSNFDTTTDDMDFLIKEIERLGKDL